MALRIKYLIGIAVLAIAANVAAQNSAATIPASFQGTYTTTYGLINEGGPFIQSQEVTFVIGADNTLCINGQTLTNPVHPSGNPAEAAWIDEANGVAYAVSNLTASFNEVNVAGAGFSPFYGQLSGSKTSDSVECSANTVAAPEITSEMNAVFTLAESKLGKLFPAGAETQTLDQYVYRFYKSTGIYLAFADGNVLLLGGEFGDAIVNVGSISFVTSELEKLPNLGGASDVWNLNISGSFDTSLIQNLTFGGINIPGVPAPDLGDSQAISQEITNTLAGVASNIGAITLQVVEDSASRRTFDVSFTATTSIGQVTYNLRYEYTR